MKKIYEADTDNQWVAVFSSKTYENFSGICNGVNVQLREKKL
jgi:hypothetical protein